MGLLGAAMALLIVGTALPDWQHISQTFPNFLNGPSYRPVAYVHIFDKVWTIADIRLATEP